MLFPPKSSQQSSLLKSLFWVAQWTDQNLQWLPITCRSMHTFLTMTSETFPDLASVYLFLAQIDGTMNARTAWWFFTSSCCFSSVYSYTASLFPSSPTPNTGSLQTDALLVSRSTPSSILPCWVRISLPFDCKNLHLHLCLSVSFRICVS